jgi:hypothetical protein
MFEGNNRLKEKKAEGEKKQLKTEINKTKFKKD